MIADGSKLKKRSDANSSSKPPEPFTVFLDRSLGKKKIATALRQAGVRAFVLTGGDLQGGEMAEIFVKALPAIKRFAARNHPPFIAKVTRGGKVSKLTT